MTTSEEIKQQLPELNDETAERMAEAVRKAGMSTTEACKAFRAMTEVIQRAAEVVAEVWNQLSSTVSVIVQDSLPEAMLQTVATPKEWHLMNHAKKARTRKKYRNRLTRRLIR